MAIFDTLTAAYKFEGNADDSKGTDNLTGTNVSYNSSYGKSGQGCNFVRSNSSYITSSVDGGTGSSTTVSYSMWIRPQSQPATNTQHAFFLKYISSGARHEIDYRDSSGTKQIAFNFSGSQLIHNVTLTTNTWYHIVVTISGNGSTCYVNGSSVGTKNDGGQTGDTDRLNIGCRLPTTDGRYFDGDIDEVYIFNSTLSSGDVSTLYNYGNGTFYAVVSGPSNLKSYNTNLKANIKSINTNLIGNIKSLNTNA